MLALLLCVACVCCLVGCVTKVQQKTADTVFMRATVTQIENGSMLVRPVEGSRELSSSDSFSVPLTGMQASPEPQIGDEVEIEYSGDILETYPAGLGKVFGIRVVSRQESQPEDITFAVKEESVTATGAVFVLTNQTEDKTYTYGEPYTVEKLSDDKWQSVTPKEGLTWIAGVYSLQPGQQSELILDWQDGYGRLEPGRYRLTKAVSDEQGNGSVVYAAFEVVAIEDEVK